MSVTRSLRARRRRKRMSGKAHRAKSGPKSTFQNHPVIPAKAGIQKAI